MAKEDNHRTPKEIFHDDFKLAVKRKQDTFSRATSQLNKLRQGQPLDNGKNYYDLVKALIMARDSLQQLYQNNPSLYQQVLQELRENPLGK